MKSTAPWPGASGAGGQRAGSNIREHIRAQPPADSGYAEQFWQLAG